MILASLRNVPCKCQCQEILYQQTRLVTNHSEKYLNRPGRRRKAKKIVKVDPTLTSVNEGALLLKSFARGRPGSYELFIHTKQNNPYANALKGRVFLPHPIGTASEEVIAVFATGELAEAAKEAGADHVGTEDLINKILQGQIEPNRVIATPDTIRLLTSNREISKFLGPKGLMPSVKRGTVTENVQLAIQEAKGGLDWRAHPKSGVIESVVGRLVQDGAKVEANVRCLIDAVKSVDAGITKPQTTGSGINTRPKPLIDRLYLKTTQGPRIQVNV